jgi:hypothetical protein
MVDCSVLVLLFPHLSTINFTIHKCEKTLLMRDLNRAVAANVSRNLGFANSAAISLPRWRYGKEFSLPDGLRRDVAAYRNPLIRWASPAAKGTEFGPGYRRFSDFPCRQGISQRAKGRAQTEKYLAWGWWTTIAEVYCSGSSWSSSESVMPISSALSRARSCFWSARLGQAG